MIPTKKIAVTGMLTAIGVILVGLLGIATPVVKINFGFIPVVIAAACLGPIYSMIVYALMDIICFILFPTGGAYLPLLTLSIALAGLTFGLVLYRRRPDSNMGLILYSLIAPLIVNLLFVLGIDSFLLHYYFKLSYAAMLPGRLLKIAIMIPLQTIVICTLSIKLVPLLKRWSTN